MITSLVTATLIPALALGAIGYSLKTLLRVLSLIGLIPAISILMLLHSFGFVDFNSVVQKMINQFVDSSTKKTTKKSDRLRKLAADIPLRIMK